MEIESVLQEKFIHGGAAGVCLAALRDWIFAIPLWINVIAATWEQDSLHAEQEPGNTILTLVERHNYGRYPGRMESGEVGWQRTLVIGRISAGGLGNGDVDGHAAIV
jgi:hypothetical protein